VVAVVAVGHADVDGDLALHFLGIEVGRGGTVVDAAQP
jgi:hypothetical protein